jgi:YbbR domain-containing protein
MGWLIRNWELKIGAAGLATVLYTGLVFSGSFSESHLPGVQIQRINQPNGAYVITQQLPTVDVHYRQSRDTPGTPSTDSFAATVDLSQYDMQRAGQAQSLPVQVRSLADGVTSLDFTPQQVTVTLDVLDQRTVPVFLDRGEVPPTLELGTPVLSADNVTARGPRSLVSQVVRAEARVAIDASGIDVNEQVHLQAVDAAGQPVSSVELTPDTISVQIPVATQETSKTVPVQPRIAGSPAAGFQISQVVVNPPTVTLRGTPDKLADLIEVTTEPISVQGLTANRDFTARPVLPNGVRLLGSTGSTVGVHVVIGPAQASKTFLVGVVCRNVPSGSSCLPQVSQISMTLAGSQPALAALKASSFTPFLDVAGLGPGTHQVTPQITLPQGLSLVAFAPGQVNVVITAAPSPSPSPGA